MRREHTYLVVLKRPAIEVAYMEVRAASAPEAKRIAETHAEEAKLDWDFEDRGWPTVDSVEVEE